MYMLPNHAFYSGKGRRISSVAVLNDFVKGVECNCNIMNMKTVISLTAVDATPSNFAEFGQVLGPMPDGATFGPDDAQLCLNNGIPRFYIMTLKARPLRFRSITHHAKVSQCLGSIGGRQWYMAVAKRSIVEHYKSKIEKSALSSEITEDNPNIKIEELANQSKHDKMVCSSSGHYYIPPTPDDIKVFCINGPQFIKLNVGTWHAGPLFLDTSMNFYNLELSDTNEVDHTTHYFEGITFEIKE